MEEDYQLHADCGDDEDQLQADWDGYSDDGEDDEQLTPIPLHRGRRPAQAAPTLESQRLPVVDALSSDLIRDATFRGRFSTATPEGQRGDAATFPGIGLRL